MNAVRLGAWRKAHCKLREYDVYQASISRTYPEIYFFAQKGNVMQPIIKSSIPLFFLSVFLNIRQALLSSLYYWPNP